MNPETLSALIIGIGGLITATGVCLHRFHFRHVKMKTCCGTELSVDMSQTPKQSLDVAMEEGRLPKNNAV